MSCVYFAAILTILPPSWRQKRYCLLFILWATGRSVPENML